MNTTSSDYEEDRRHALLLEIWNRRDSSWYGGNSRLATLENVKATLRVPAGYEILPTGNRESTLSLGGISGQDGRSGQWLVRMHLDSPSMTPSQPLRAEAVAADATRSSVASSSLREDIPGFQIHNIARSGNRWLEPNYQSSAFAAAVEVCSSEAEIRSPRLSIDGMNEQVTYRDILRPNMRLVIGPGSRALLFSKSLFDSKIRHFHPHKPEANGLVKFQSGYSIFAARGPLVESGERYRLAVTGLGLDGDNFFAVIRFEGQRLAISKVEEFQVLRNS